MHSLPVHPTTLDRVIGEAILQFRIPRKDILSRSRRQPIPDVRYAIFSALSSAGYGYGAILNAFPTFTSKESVRRGVMRARDLSNTDTKYAARLAAIRETAKA